LAVARILDCRSDTVQTFERFRADPYAGDDEDIFLDDNRAFHFGVADVCGNARLAAVEHDLLEQAYRLIRLSLRHLQNGSVPQAIKEHNAIIDAIQAHYAETRLSSRGKCTVADRGSVAYGCRDGGTTGEHAATTRT
jgi:DNA-binding FadR family transcriptional regulator